MPRRNIHQAAVAFNVVSVPRMQNVSNQIFDEKRDGTEEDGKHDEHDHIFAEPARLRPRHQRLRLPLRGIGAQHGHDAVDTGFDTAGKIAALGVRDDGAENDG